MSTDDSRCGFPNCDCKNFIPLKFQDKCLYKGCGHDIDLHAANVNLYFNASFATPPSAPTPQYRNVATDSRPPLTCLGPPTTHHSNFVSSIARETVKTTARSATSDYELIKLSQKFAQCDRPKKKTGKQKKGLKSQQYLIFTET